jgi:hypothetical protein
MVFASSDQRKLVAETLTAYTVFCTGFRAYRLELLRDLANPMVYERMPPSETLLFLMR